MVHPYDDVVVMAGQGTAALELIEEVGALDALQNAVLAIASSVRTFSSAAAAGGAPREPRAPLARS